MANYTSEQYEKCAQTQKKLFEDPNYRAWRTSINRQIMQSPETRAKCHNQGSFKKGHIVSDEMRTKISQATKIAMARPEVKAKVVAGNESRKGKPNPAHSIYMKQRWQNPEYRQRQLEKWMVARQVKPNKTEQRLMALFDKSNLPFRYVGDGQVIIAGRCPDFINTNGRKQLIELFGVYWHPVFDVALLKEHYRQYGFDLLIIWDDELKDIAKILRKVNRFVKAGGKV